MRRFSNITVFLSAILLVSCLSGHAIADEPFDFVAFREARDVEYRQQLESIAATCERLKLNEQAGLTRGWQVPRDPKRQYLFLPEGSWPAVSPDDANLVYWLSAFRKLRMEQADWLFEQARAFCVEQPALSFQLLHETLHENPDHAEARAMLGFTREGDEWLRRERAIRTRKVKMRHVALPDRLLWQAESGNFKIITTLDEATAREVAEKFERWHDVWQQVFYGFWARPDQLEKMFAGQSVGERARQHVVIVFRDKAEYDEQLTPFIPGVDISSGYYTDKLKQSFFFVGDQPDETTWRHELTHQLFEELARRTRPARSDSIATEHGAWALEGIAMYMESLRDFGSYATLGGFESKRLQYARLRRFREGFRPIPELVMQQGLPQLQQDPEVAKYYATSAGYCHFLMNADHGQKRGALLHFLEQLYFQQSQPLQVLTSLQLTSEEFDSQYAKFLYVSSDEIAKYLLQAEQLNTLSLVPSNTTDDDLRNLKGAINLQLLDLTGTKITDSSAECLEKFTRLERLFLEKTSIGDVTLEVIGGLPTLVELDLTGTAISDQGLKHLAALPNLKVLWLGGTHISGEGIQQLAPLKQLEMLDVSGTGVGPGDLELLRKSLPNLR
jgi:hypothetical protein